MTNVAFETKAEKASRKLERAKDHLLDVESIRDTVSKTLREQETLTFAQSAMLQTAKDEVRKAEQAVVRANNKLVAECKIPREIYARDPGRDSVMTRLKLDALLLPEFVLKEYFGDLRMQWRTFIEQYMLLPVAVRTSRRRVLEGDQSPIQSRTMKRSRGGLPSTRRRGLLSLRGVG